MLGAILSGIVGNKIGGYDSVWALPSCILAASICIIAALIVPATDNFRILISLIWIMLFAGGYILPILTGVMLDQVENELRPAANSFANFCYYLIGWLPAPTIYGAVCSLTGGKKSRWGMIVLMYTTIPAVFTLTIASLTRKRKKSRSRDNLLETKNQHIPQLNSFGLEVDVQLGVGIPRSFVEAPEMHQARHKRRGSFNSNHEYRSHSAVSATRLEQSSMGF